MKRETLIETYESISEGELRGEVYQIPVSGWNIKNEEKLIEELMEEHFDYKIKSVKVLHKSERAFSCSKYEDGEDANDCGFAFFINYHLNWRRGLGKCTLFSVKFALQKQTEVKNE